MSTCSASWANPTRCFIHEQTRGDAECRLLIHIDEWGPMAFGKTYRYCTRCELIIAHQDELEAPLAESFTRIALDVIGNQYIVLGTVDKRIWQRGLQGSGHPLGEVLKHMADFKTVLDLKVEPRGWYPASQE
jgi:hypothetical protein